MPPLAMTKRGGKVLSVRLHHGDDGGGDGARDPQAFGGVVGLDQQAAGVDDDVAAAEGLDDRVNGLVQVARPRSSPSSFSTSISTIRAALCCSVRALSWRVVTPDVRADDDQAAGFRGGVAGVGFLAAEFGADFLADAGADERRAHAVEELLAAAFRFFQAQGQGAQIVFGDDVRHDRGGVRGGVDGVGDGLGGDASDRVRAPG